ncbi:MULTISPECIES: UDP-2,3-diacylglucosamine diphosphatase [Idiomarina]|uniref:UDP-2,3-diacylglucosamine diphosphatase n=1 Tax=Idiomarina TaxID=135575 RepID=UPI00129BBA75|nr:MULTISPECIES: UDP-2,3-diacylglucosamine diphosphatase [Idiomarina]MRJ41127.1 UDP-2,3-diacylglucosamine diphosphatase [Idiomarina sp. FeN1]NCU56292.1 UDP-2,3-diacylglucosamine diphosphatase [Idiomarina sp. FenA--70]NCU59311.1 UDP-2,3-diacylglucosamine diphosphatase [Idiomarina sp. FenBw--71]UUN12488.1 UDP-2,3-diacylglucosamine diphosphatase [Idiomarina loihiensis]
MAATTWFIADLHLSPARPDITALFLQFLRQQAPNADALYILGDLFDAWIGDDDNSDFAQSIQAALAELTQQGVAVYFIAGNRDFLIGPSFAKRTGVTLLPEASVIDLYGCRTLIMHGDSLCTDDVSYQRFRRIIRHPWLTKLLLRLPLAWRMRIANKLRANSATQKPLTDAQLKIMDVNQHAVVEAMQQHQVQWLIHGHTHRPNIHQVALANQALAQRIVLGDWYQQGSWLAVTAQGLQLHTAPLR